MADDEKDLGDGPEDGGEASSEPKKDSSGVIGKLLKFVAIGLAALIFIVTVVIITFKIMSGSGATAQAAIPQTEAYAAIKPIYSYYDGLGNISTRSRDPTPYNIVAAPVLEYDLNDTATQTELIARKVQLIDFFLNYFSSKYQTSLQPENRSKIKEEIKELLNTTVFDKARVRGVLFTQFDLFEMQ
ncbi:MAG: flagellar basal body-associated FliL family protein [Spirochaetaceae bacterium]|jgi:flagellar FliL protein|nr:flagellar basal body-associated FliL family protein [Spirochaetaceae bacterium]